MAIRFRFRSSVNLDSVDIEGRDKISIGDLKSKIVHNKHLNICQDFDLLFSDALTAQEYYDENVQIPSGSSVIIKRVPKGPTNSDVTRGKSLENVRVKDANLVKASNPVNAEFDCFDDFGAELCPVPKATAPGSDLNADKCLYFNTDVTTNEVPRSIETPSVGCQKLDASELSEAIPRGPLHIDDNEDMSQIKSKPSVEVFTRPEMVVSANPQDRENVELPAELKCSLCDTFFKDAVMIPCCQHSFCEKCIHLVLIKKGRCPKCLSTKYKVEDLLPNVSLRQAIKHFLDSQILIRNSDDACGYVPDEESGIQANGKSCAVSIQQREVELPHSPHTTEKGSNQIIANGIGGKLPLAFKLTQIDAEKHGFMHLVDSERQPEDLAADFQGENQLLHEEAESTIKEKRSLHVHAAGVDRSYIETGRYRKGNRTCYMCGSPDHFIRDCPAASSPHAMLQTGNFLFSGAMPCFFPPNWNGAPFPQIRPFVDPYGSHLSATMVRPTTYAVPTYMPSMYGGMAPHGCFMGMGGPASIVAPSAEWHLGLSDYWERQGYEKRQKLSHDNLMRGQSFDGNDEDGSDNKWHHFNEAVRSYDPKSHRDREDSLSHSEGSFVDRPDRKYRHLSHIDDPERSNSEVEDMPSRSNWHSEEQHMHHYRKSKEHGHRRHRGVGDSSHSHHQSNIAKDVHRERVGPDAKRDKRKHHSQSGSGLEPSLSSDQKTQWKDRDSSHSSRHSKHNSRSANNDPSHERWQMVSGPDEDGEENYHHHKRKRRP